MSIEASSFVLGLSMGQGNGIRKLILLGYANHGDKFGRGAYPSTRTIADYAECDVRTVQRHLRWLIERGYLHEGDQRMVDHLDRRYRPIVYDIAISTEQIELGNRHWPGQREPCPRSAGRAPPRPRIVPGRQRRQSVTPARERSAAGQQGRQSVTPRNRA